MATTSLEAVDTPAPYVGFASEEIVGYARSASDVLRLLAYSILALALFLLTRWARDAVLGFESDLAGLFDFIEPPAARVLEGIAQVFAAVVGICVLAIPIVLRRFRIFGYLIVANIVSGTLVGLVVDWLDEDQPRQVANELAERAGINIEGSITPAGVAAIAASFVILAPFVSARWRRAGAVLVVLLVAMRIVLSTELPAELFLALAVGAASGAAVLLAFGRPDRHPTLAGIAASLGATGLAVTAIEPVALDGRDARGYVAMLSDGVTLEVKVRSPDERSADILFRVYRYLRLKNVGDERPFVSLRRAVEHEALVSLQARDVGVRTPRLRAIAEVGTDSMLLAFDRVDGLPLDSIDASELDDAALRATWEQLAHLRAHRIAHRDLRRASVVVDGGKQPWLVDFGFSEVAVADSLLDADVAQLLATLTLLVGPDRAVDSAIVVLGTDAVSSSLPRLQLNALSGRTRAALRQQKGLLAELQSTASARCGVAPPQLVPLTRVDVRLLFVFAMLVAVVYFLLPQFSDLPGVIEQVEEANWWWFVPVLIGSVVTYLGATFGMVGSVPQPVRFPPAFVAQVATSFTGTLAPAAVGRMAVNVRFLQKSGVDPAVAVPAVGVNVVIGIAVHILLLLLFVVWAGRSAFGAIHLPDPRVLLYGLAGVLVFGAIAFAIPAIRHMLRDRLVPVLRRSISGLYAVVRRPTKIALLIGGSVVVTSGYMASLYFATLAFGGDLSFAQVGAIYLAGSAVASAAPTPGGLGALEAAVIAGLVAAGMPNDIAVPSVFLFRLGTFWIPILPGWLAYSYLRHEDYL